MKNFWTQFAISMAISAVGIELQQLTALKNNPALAAALTQYLADSQNVLMLLTSPAPPPAPVVPVVPVH